MVVVISCTALNRGHEMVLPTILTTFHSVCIIHKTLVTQVKTFEKPLQSMTQVFFEIC